MKQRINHITGVLKKSLRFLFFIILFNNIVGAQTPSNLDEYYELVDSATSLLLNDLGESKEVYLNLDLGDDYTVFGNQIRGKLLRSNIKILTDTQDSGNMIDFVIEDCQVEYGEPKRDGWFGDYYTERTLQVSGNYYISAKSEVKPFNISKSDIIRVQDVEKVENRSYPFTRGDLPPEPFFSSLLEPVVVIAATAITIILFFSVRSK